MAPPINDKKSKLPLIVFVVAAVYLIVLAAFSWGYLSFKHKFFPHQLIEEMQGSVSSVTAQVELERNPRSAHEILHDVEKGGVTVNLLPDDQDDVIFVTWYRGEQFIAQLIDRKGHVVHGWKIPHGDIDMSLAMDRAVILFVRNQTIHGAHLSPNGDVLLVNEYHGMVKLNKESELLWRTKDANHHAVTVDPNGFVWSLNRTEVKEKDSKVALAGATYVDDTVVKYTPDGELIDQFSVAQLIENNRYDGILYGGPPWSARLHDRDALHLNDIDVLDSAQAGRFPNVESGNLMLSLRTLNTVIIVDPISRALKWSMTGPFLRQHDPQITGSGTLLVYDNRTVRAQLGANARYLRNGQKLGYSRLIAIDPSSREIQWEYSGTREHPFFSSIQGKHEELPNGNVLVVEPEGGRIFEIEPESGQIVWEYVNKLEQGYVGRVTQAVPFQRKDLLFLDD